MNSNSDAATMEQLRSRYPIAGRVDRWFFRVREVSAGCYTAEGRDTHGRSASRQSTDPDTALAQCIADAQQIAEPPPNI